jgi:hypothetical protein
MGAGAFGYASSGTALASSNLVYGRSKRGGRPPPVTGVDLKGPRKRERIPAGLSCTASPKITGRAWSARGSWLSSHIEQNSSRDAIGKA